MAVALAATATVKATTTTTPSPTATVATAPTPAATPAAGAVRVARHERGARVRGSVLVARPLSRLRVEALAKRSAVGARRPARGPGPRGQTVRSPAAGRVSLSLALNVTARRALRRSGRLALTVMTTVTPASGPAFTAARPVALKR